MNCVQTDEQKMDFFKVELLKLGYFKTPEGKQLYELEIDKLRELYEEQKLHKTNMK